MPEQMMKQIRLDLGSRAVAIVFVDRDDPRIIVSSTSGVLVTLDGRHLVATCGHGLAEFSSNPIVLCHGQANIFTVRSDAHGLRFAKSEYAADCRDVFGRIAWHPDSGTEGPGKLDLGLMEILDPAKIEACGLTFHNLGIGGICESIAPLQELRVVGWPAEMLVEERSGRHSMANMDTGIVQDFEALTDRFVLGYEGVDPYGTRTNSDGRVYRVKLDHLIHPGGMSGGGVWAMMDEGPTSQGVWMPNRFRLAGIQFAAKHNHYLVAMKIKKWLEWARGEIVQWAQTTLPAG